MEQTDEKNSTWNLNTTYNKQGVVSNTYMYFRQKISCDVLFSSYVERRQRERERFSLGLMKITIPFLNWKYFKIMATRCSVCDTQRIDSKEIVLLRCYHASSFLLVRLAQKSTLSSLHTSVQSFNYRTFARSGYIHARFDQKDKENMASKVWDNLQEEFTSLSVRDQRMKRRLFHEGFRYGLQK